MDYIFKTNTEFNIQASLFQALRNKLEPLEYKVFGEVRILTKDIILKTRKVKGRLDIGIFKNRNLLCAVEVKLKGTKGWKKQKNKYLNLGVKKIFICSGLNNINQIVENCLEFLIKEKRKE